MLSTDSKILNKINSIDIRYKLVFLCSVISGFLSHSVGLFNKFSIHDDLYYFFDIGKTISLGRWMLALIGQFSKIFYGTGFFALPLFNGFMAIVYLALSACFIVSILDINNKVMCSFVGLLMVSFPAVTSMMGYSFTISFYCIGLLLGFVGLYLLVKEKIVYKVLGTILITLSLGTYQAFMPIIISVLLIRLILNVVKGGKIKEILTNILVSGVSLVVSLGCYLLITKICNSIFDVELESYQGISSMTSFSLGEILNRIGLSYIVFFNPRVGGLDYAYPNNILYLYIIVVLFLVVSCLLCFMNLIKKSKIHAYIFLGLSLLFPMACNFICVMSDYTVVHSLMVYGQITPFILCLAILGKLPKEIKLKYLYDIGIVFFCVVMLMYVRFNNTCYLKAQITQNELVSYYTTLVTQIKSVEGYKDEYPVVVINPQTIHDSSTTRTEEFENINQLPYYNYYVIVNDYTWAEYIKIWCGYEPEWVPVYDYEGGNAEVDEMPSYPDYGSIKVIDNEVVVKFS